MYYFTNILPKIEEALYLMVIGMGIVFGVLMLFSAIIWLLQKIDYKLSKLPRPTYTEKDIIIEDNTVKKENYRELIAVITAAIVALDTKHKYVVKKVKYIKEKPKSWVSTGRSELLGHNIIKRK